MKFVNFQTDRLKNVGLLSDAEAGKVLNNSSLIIQ